MKFIYFLLVAVLSVSPLNGQENVKMAKVRVPAGEKGEDVKLEKGVVRRSVKEFLEKYPQATLQDIYKNNFQDYFGPSHIMADREGVLRYLNQELAQMEQEAKAGKICREEKTVSGSGGKVGKYSRYYDPCGWRHNYYQVSLLVIKEGFLTVEEFADAFMAGGGEVPEVTPIWLDEWEAIKEAVKAVVPQLEGFEEDAAKIDSLLQEGKYVVHHSVKYGEYYCPHYRIIRGDIFEKVVLPKILVVN